MVKQLDSLPVLLADFALQSGISDHDLVKAACLLEQDVHGEDFVRPKLLLVLVNHPEEVTGDVQGLSQLHLVMGGHVLHLFLLSFHQLRPVSPEAAGEVRKVLEGVQAGLNVRLVSLEVSNVP